MVEFLKETPLLCDESFDESFTSNGFDESNSVNLNLENGSPSVITILSVFISILTLLRLKDD